MTRWPKPIKHAHVTMPCMNTEENRAWISKMLSCIPKQWSVSIFLVNDPNDLRICHRGSESGVVDYKAYMGFLGRDELA